jgi:hypothetical protein
VIFLKKQLILKIEAHRVHILRRVCNCANCSSEKNTPSAPVDLSLLFVSRDETSGKLIAELIETMPICLMNCRLDSSHRTEPRVIRESIWSSRRSRELIAVYMCDVGSFQPPDAIFDKTERGRDVCCRCPEGVEDECGLSAADLSGAVESTRDRVIWDKPARDLMSAKSLYRARGSDTRLYAKQQNQAFKAKGEAQGQMTILRVLMQCFCGRLICTSDEGPAMGLKRSARARPS